MISKRTLAAIGLILIPVGALAALLQAAKDPPTELYIRTTPAGATLFLDGKNLGTAPDIFEVAPGKHELLAVLEGCKSAKRDIVVPATRIERVILTLESLSSSADAEDAATPQAAPSGVSSVKQLQQAKDDLKAAKTIFLPYAETPGVAGVLDLASGAMLPISGDMGFSAMREFTRRHHKGDLYHGYDEEDGGAFIGCLRGATAVIWDGNRARPLGPSQRREEVTVYRSPPLPCRLLITTAEKKVFDLTLLSTGRSGESDKGIPRNVSGIRLRYQLADPGIPPTARFESTGESDPQSKTFFLPDVESPGVGVVLDLASGRVLPPISNRSEGLREYANLDRGDLFYDDANGGVLGCLRGAEIKIWDDDRLVTLATVQSPTGTTICKLPPLPCQLVIITPEKKRANVMILAAGTSKEGDAGLPKGVPGIHLRYTLSEAAEPLVDSAHAIGRAMKRGG